jgi:hypothetical protein
VYDSYISERGGVLLGEESVLMEAVRPRAKEGREREKRGDLMLVGLPLPAASRALRVVEGEEKKGFLFVLIMPCFFVSQGGREEMKMKTIGS